MVYIYRKVAGDKQYYYLRASKRKGNRIISKDLAYLGNSIEEVKKNLAGQNKEQIRKAYKTINKFFESNHFLEEAKQLKQRKDEYLPEKLDEIEACRLHFNSVFQKKDELTKKEIWKNFVIEFAFNTTSIEGNTIKLNEARNLLQEGLTPKNKTLREIYDVQNTEKVFMNLSKEKLTHELVIKIHDSLLENIDARKGYRTEEVRVLRSNFKATPFPYVRADMELLIKWYNQNKTLHPFVLAVIFHHKFEKIHPFMDGNGRTGRMLMNYILMAHNYLPFVFYNKARLEYLQTLRRADSSNPLEAKKEHYLPLVLFSAGQMLESYWNIFL